MTGKRELLSHYLAALAYRTQKALRGAPETFHTFRVASDVRTPTELVRHMTSVLGYACTFFVGGAYRADPLPSWQEEVDRFHAVLARLRAHFLEDAFSDRQPEHFLQGPLADAMTHAGQLALLRRLHRSPVPPENFIMADIRSENVSENQPPPAAPDEEWHTPEGLQPSSHPQA